jgi:hypothetical protein
MLLTFTNYFELVHMDELEAEFIEEFPYGWIDISAADNEYDDLEEVEANEMTATTAGAYFEHIEDLSFRDKMKRLGSNWMQIPLPNEYTPTGGSPLADLDDDALLYGNAGLLCHIAQTAANGGLQIVAPQQVPLGATLAHTAHEKRTADMYITGSIASSVRSWPVVRERMQPSIVDHEPIDSGAHGPAVRKRTKTKGIAPPSSVLTDPIAKAFTKARGLIDLQNRIDVGGDGQAVAEVIGKAWNVSSKAFTDMGDVSLAPEGSLLRYAARADVVMPRVYAPLQRLLSVSTAAPATGRLVYGQYAAFDWRRARVLCEFTFLQSVRLEGMDLVDISLPIRPGNPGGSALRTGTLQMRPKPGAVWSHDPRTFALRPPRMLHEPGGEKLNPRVAAVMSAYDMDITALAVATSGGAGVSYSRTMVMNPRETTGAEVVAGYSTMTHGHLASRIRGKTGVAAIRNALYTILAEAVDFKRVRLFTFLSELRMASEDVGLTNAVGAPTYITMASRFTHLCVTMRAEIAAEAEHRGESIEIWWGKFSQGMPKEIGDLGETSKGWGRMKPFRQHP